MNIKIIVAVHKPYPVPNGDIYLPVQMGAANNPSTEYQSDSEGIHISERNPFFCELTGMYWGWKNLEADYKGLVHYRRHFKGKKDILNKEEAQHMLQVCDIILPRKRHYYIETIFSHYAHTHHKEDLIITGDIIRELEPEYFPYYEKVLKERSAHMFNMCIMKKEYYNAYCEWLFPLLFELEKRIDISKYSAFDARLFGRISEILLNVWISKNRYSYKVLPLFYTEKVNWLKKGVTFLKAKFFKKKYKKSF